MTRRSTHGTTRHTEAAADALLAWLKSQTAPAPHGSRPNVPTLINPGTDGGAGAPVDPSEPVLAGPVAAERQGEANRTDACLSMGAPHDAPLRLAHTDWLYHRLTVSGPADAVAALQAATAGGGVIPWQLDLDRLEEDVFHLLTSPPPPQTRRLSVAGARILAAQLRDAVACRQTLAVARLGSSRACPFDLQAVLPVPEAVLRRGPDDPAALAWLWTHWGTTAALRQVTAVATVFADDPAPTPGDAVFRVSFFSADWSPWRALAALASEWPALRFALRPIYSAA